MKMLMRIGLILLSVSTVSVVYLAQDNSKRSPSLTNAPQPSSEMQSLTKALSGEWSLSVRFEPGPATPSGLVNAGEEIWRAGPGGYTLLEEEHLRMPQGNAFLLGAIWWNKTTKRLQGMECQNLLPYTCDVKGAQNDITMGWDGKEFVIDEIETSNTGTKSMWHEVWSDISPTSFTQTGEYGAPGGPRKRLFTIHATKVSSSSNASSVGIDAANSAGSHGDEPAQEVQGLTKAIQGKWSTTYNFVPGGMAPVGGSGTGEEIWRTGPGGFVLIEEEHIRAPIGEVFLIAFHWWDKTTNSLRGMLCNNSGPAACDFNSYYNSSLKWDGKQLVIDMEFPQDSKKMMWHEAWTDITATSFTQTGDMGEVSGPLKRAVTIQGTRMLEGNR